MMGNCKLSNNVNNSGRSDAMQRHVVAWRQPYKATDFALRQFLMENARSRDPIRHVNCEGVMKEVKE